jgi:flagellin
MPSTLIFMGIKMTAINTNTASLNAQHFLAKTNKEMESSMTKLSSGLKVNSAADDAAGLAIAGRMTSQIKGLQMAVKNANDTVALAQTAEGAMEEVTNMLQRMRELAVQSANGTMNDSDRSSLDAEVQALKTEIDRIAGTTQFNNQNLLDGTFSKTFQIGDKTGQTVGLDISSVSTASLGIGSAVSDTSITGTRMAGTGSIGAGDISINGQAIGAIADLSDMEDTLKAINANVRNVTATAHNIVVAKLKGTGVTAADQLQIKVTEAGVSTATTFSISASGTMSELVANINKETGGVVTASVDKAGKLTLSNNTGASILVQDTVVGDDVQSTATGFLGDSDFSAAGTKFHGFVTLASTDGSDVTIERGNLGVASTGTDTDLSNLGFNQISRIAEGDKYSITGNAVTAEDTAWVKDDVIINGVDVYNANIATDSLAGKIDAINAKSSETGVVASAYYENIFDFTGATIVTGDKYNINGVQVSTVGTSVASLAAKINTVTSDTGIKAEANGVNLILKGTNVINVKLEVLKSDDTATADLDSTQEGYLEATQNTRLRLDSVNNTPIRIQLGEGAAIAEHGFVETNIGASDYDVNDALFSAGTTGGTSGLSVKSTTDATSALTMIDKAISSVSDIRSDLGALQNRLDHTVNNLSSVANNTAGAKSRIMDTDFATETANLTKQQILSQAATSMLAQANQSKQGILALLQG